jgi:hypothetical protein
LNQKEKRQPRRRNAQNDCILNTLLIGGAWLSEQSAIAAPNLLLPGKAGTGFTELRQLSALGAGNLEKRG